MIIGYPVNSKHLHNIYTMPVQRLRRWTGIVFINVIQMFCVYWVVYQRHNPRSASSGWRQLVLFTKHDLIGA